MKISNKSVVLCSFTITASIVALLTFAASCFAPGGFDSLGAEPTDVEIADDQIRNTMPTRSKSKELRNRVTDLLKTNAELRARIRRMEQELAAKISELGQAEAKLESLRSRKASRAFIAEVTPSLKLVRHPKYEERMRKLRMSNLYRLHKLTELLGDETIAMKTWRFLRNAVLKEGGTLAELVAIIGKENEARIRAIVEEAPDKPSGYASVQELGEYYNYWPKMGLQHVQAFVKFYESGRRPLAEISPDETEEREGRRQAASMSRFSSESTK